MNYFSFLPTLFSWWYSRGIADFFTFYKVLYKNIYNTFSVTVLLQTFFSPWKKMVQERRPGLEGFKAWLLDSLISRGVGMVVRSMMIFIFGISSIFYLFLFAFTFILWMGMPFFIFLAFMYLFFGYKL